MEYLNDYLTRDGWKRDLNQTKQDFNNLYSHSRQELSDIVRSEKGSSSTAMLFTTTGLCMSTVGVTSGNYGLSAGGILLCLAGLIDAIGSYRYNKKK